MRSTGLASLAIVLVSLCGAVVTPLAAQSVVDTYPNKGETDVSSNLGQIQVAFDRPMMPGSWSLLQESTSRFPEYEGAPRFSADRQSFYLDCKLQPNTTYVLWLNHGQHNKFRDITGQPAQPFRLSFRTAEAGKKAIYSLGDDPIVEQNTLNLANKEGHVRYTRDQLATLGHRDKLTLVAHGSPTTLGAMSPDGLTQYLADSGITALDTLSLKGCESAEFAMELKASLDRANIPVERITARLGLVTIADTGNTLVTQPDGSLAHKAAGTKIEITREGILDAYAGNDSYSSPAFGANPGYLTGKRKRDSADDDDSDLEWQPVKRIKSVHFDPGNPDTWERPSWQGSAALQRADVWGSNLVRQRALEVLLENDEVQILYYCPICGQLVSFMGAGIDHIVPWKEYARMQDVQSPEDLERTYHDPRNLWILHANCNASKGDASVADVLARQHNPYSPATWGRRGDVTQLAARIAAIKSRPEISDNDRQFLDRCITELATQGNAAEVGRRVEARFPTQASASTAAPASSTH